MKLSSLLVLFLLSVSLTTSAQSQSPYDSFASQAQEFYKQGEYLKAAESFSRAFASNNNLGRTDHRHTAAKCWAIIGQPDSAFYQLQKTVKAGFFQNHMVLTLDSQLASLHNDARWPELVALAKSQEPTRDPNLDSNLVNTLDSVYFTDQADRSGINDVVQKYGMESPEVSALWKKISLQDSINLIKVKTILDKQGWLGADIVGQQGNSTLFLVIQHADLATQEKYLPMMRDAVKNRKASAADLALLEDRVALGKGKKQIYGSQVGMSKKTGQYYVFAMEDPANVDKRRAEVGLGPMIEYARYFKIDWSLEQYEKDIALNK